MSRLSLAKHRFWLNSSCKTLSSKNPNNETHLLTVISNKNSLFSANDLYIASQPPPWLSAIPCHSLPFSWVGSI